MNKLIEEWLTAEKRVQVAHKYAADALEKAKSAPLPVNLRPAEPVDIKEGAILWYPDFEGDRKWCRVDEVIRPDDRWKAFCADDGSRYGLDGAFIEV